MAAAPSAAAGAPPLVLLVVKAGASSGGVSRDPAGMLRVSGAGSSAGRARPPFTSQLPRRGCSAGAGAGRPSKSRSSSTGTPSAASAARHPSSWVRAEPPGRWAGTARCSRSPRMRPTRPVRTWRGPTSTKTRAPASCIASTSRTNSTGRTSWSASRPAIASGSSGWRSPVAFEKTGMRGVVSAVRSSSSASRRWAGATWGEWKAQDTGSSRAGRSRSPHHSMAASMSARGPATTVWSGALRLAVTTLPASSSGSSDSRSARTAAIAPSVPAAASRMQRPRASESRSRSSSVRLPAAQSATSSP